jgi:hypothetical protein
MSESRQPPEISETLKKKTKENRLLCISLLRYHFYHINGLQETEDGLEASFLSLRELQSPPCAVSSHFKLSPLSLAQAQECW